MEKNEYKSISKRSRLLLKGDENYDVDYKRSISGLSNEDLVSFANSVKGGAILLGVDEINADDGRQKGKVVGCKIGDEEKRKIIDKGESCLPPIEVRVYFENINKVPFIRIEIPSGPEKPYCTSSGKYKIRGDGVNKPLTPQRLLSLFMDSEGQLFVERFKEATKELENELSNIRSSSIELETILERTFNSAANTESLADEAVTYTDQAVAVVEELQWKIEAIEEYDLYSIHKKIDAILQKFEIEDPIRKATRDKIENFTENLLSEGKTEEEVIEEINKIWSQHHLNASYTEVISWCKRKIMEIEQQMS